jgi:hypothetical protein
LESGGQQDHLVILAFSGGGTRAAAFSYGVLEALRRIEIVTNSGRKIRLLDEVDVITAYRAAASPRWRMACMAKSCSMTTRRAFSNATCKAS